VICWNHPQIQSRDCISNKWLLKSIPNSSMSLYS